MSGAGSKNAAKPSTVCNAGWLNLTIEIMGGSSGSGNTRGPPVVCFHGEVTRETLQNLKPLTPLQRIGPPAQHDIDPEKFEGLVATDAQAVRAQGDLDPSQTCRILENGAHAPCALGCAAYRYYGKLRQVDDNRAARAHPRSAWERSRPRLSEHSVSAMRGTSRR